MESKFKIGDLITAYHAGIHKIIKIERRFYKDENDIPLMYRDQRKPGDEYSPLIWYKKVLQENGELSKDTKEKVCDASYCKYATDLIRKKEQELNKLKDNFVKL